MTAASRKRYTHVCYLCGKPCTSKTCMTCFKKGAYHSSRQWWRSGYDAKLQKVRDAKYNEKKGRSRPV
jgi:hypothetical protein